MIAENILKLLEIKADIKDAIIDKGEVVNDDFTEYAEAIRNISSGGGGELDFTLLGYDEHTPQEIKDAFNYALEIKEAGIYDFNNTTIPIKEVDTKLMFFPKGVSIYHRGTYLSGVFLYTPLVIFDGRDTTFNVKTFNSMFANCSGLKKCLFPTCEADTAAYMFLNCYSLEEVDLSNVDFSKVTSCSLMFQSCNSLKKVTGTIDCSNCTSLSYAFSLCGHLEELPNIINTEKCLDFSYMFFNTVYLKVIPAMNTTGGTNFRGFLYDARPYRIEGIDFINASTYGALHIFSTSGVRGSCEYVRYALLKNLGRYDVENGVLFLPLMQNWGIPLSVASDEHIGVNTLDARQSVIDSLVTYTYNRAAAGMSAAKVNLPKSVVDDPLTSELVALMTSKGYTILNLP